MSCPLWRVPDELCELFSIDPSEPGADSFCQVVTLAAPLLQFPGFGLGVFDVNRAVLRDLGWSPLVFWSRMKRGIAPLLSADRGALEALGLRGLTVKPTAFEMVKAAAEAMASLELFTEDEAREVAAAVIEKRRHR